MTLPFAFQLLIGYEPGARPPIGLPLFSLLPGDLAILSVCGAAGYVLARKLRIPAAALVGPMLFSAGVHLAGWTTAKPPVELVSAAQVIVGTAIGCRFAGVRAMLIIRAMVAAAGGTAVLLVTAVAFAFAVGQMTGLSMQPLVLAYAPGGLTEMSLIAIAIGADSAFVATHHIVRVFLIVVAAPLLFRIAEKSRRQRG
ncbi:MAG: AbrB family transcriptional regulator, partial [Alphaproteobacteria bacterium]